MSASKGKATCKIRSSLKFVNAIRIAMKITANFLKENSGNISLKKLAQAFIKSIQVVKQASQAYNHSKNYCQITDAKLNYYFDSNFKRLVMRQSN